MQLVQAEVEVHYRSRIVDALRAAGGTLTIANTTIRLAKQFGFCYGVERATAKLTHRIHAYLRANPGDPEAERAVRAMLGLDNLR